jgi:hypothetical protein
MSASLGKSVVTFGLAFLAGIAGACIGWLVTGFAADAMLGVGGMSDINGGRAMVAFFTFGPIGAIAGLLLGVWLVVRKRTGKGFARVASYSALVVLAITAIGAATTAWFYFSDDQLAHNTLPPSLKFELRLPPKTSLPDQLAGVKIELDTDKNTMPATVVPELGRDGDHPVIVGDVDLAFRTSQRMLVLRVPDQPDQVFSLKLAGNPGASAEFGPWQPLDFIDDNPNGDMRKAGPDEGYEIGYRVARFD